MNDELRNDPTRVPAERPDETRLDDDLAPTGQDAPAGDPTPRPEWDRHEWAGDNQPHETELTEEPTGLEPAAHPRWNEHQVVGEGQGNPDEGPDERVLPTEGANEYGGHGHNPGGGERWADVDRNPRRRE